MKTVLWWIKRDIRLLDNRAITEAVVSSGNVLPVFVFEPSLLKAPETSAFHIHSQLMALKYLKDELEELNYPLLILYGEVVQELSKLYEQIRFTEIYSHEETGVNLTYLRDKDVKKWCIENKVIWREFNQTGVFRPNISRDGRTQKWFKIMQEKIIPIPAKINQVQSLKDICSIYKFPTIEDLGFSVENKTLQNVDEYWANRALNTFLNSRGKNYSREISSPNTAFLSGSRLSVHLAWGTISPKLIYQRINSRINYLEFEQPEGWKAWTRSFRAFISRLHWRDHFVQRLESEINMEFHALNSHYENPTYSNDLIFFNAWLNGKTGFPLIDACMRCLNKTGFLNFRMRSMVTSFACHGLHLDWRFINAPLAQLFTDYEPGIHLSQLQMQAGVVGINIIRVYNPAKQLIDHDQNLQFTKKWIPELENISDELILNADNKTIPGYIPVIVDFKQNSRVMKDYLYSVKKEYSKDEVTANVLKKHGSRRKIHKIKNPRNKEIAEALF